jgi:hypothetical protein
MILEFLRVVASPSLRSGSAFATILYGFLESKNNKNIFTEPLIEDIQIKNPRAGDLSFRQIYLIKNRRRGFFISP